MKKVFETPKNQNYFFGYYDKSPLNSDNSKLLACQSSFNDRIQNQNDVLTLGYFNWKKSDDFIPVAETKAWNWQQGCMLQWLGKELNSKIIYNDRINNKFVTVIFDIETKIKTQLPMAYYTVSSEGKFALCIDNERHYWHREGYNYQGIKNTKKKVSVDIEDGIWRLDIKNKRVIRILSMYSLLNYKPIPSMRESTHYIEHLMLSPNNKRAAFLHRWIMKTGDMFSRLYTINPDGSDLYLLNDSGRMSHFCWRNESEIIGWGGLSNLINAARKYENISKYLIKPVLPLYHKLLSKRAKISNLISGDSYILFQDKTNEKYKVFANVLKYDGHPSCLRSNEDILITDTYPNKDEDFYQKLYIFDQREAMMKEFISIKHNQKFVNSACRCDLHPKVSHDGNYISIDTFTDNYRSMCLFEIGTELEQNAK